jgi:hypothetical protein
VANTVHNGTDAIPGIDDRLAGLPSETGLRNRRYRAAATVDEQRVPVLLRMHAVSEFVAARLEAEARARSTGRLDGLHRHGAACQRAKRRPDHNRPAEGEEVCHVLAF